LHAAHRRGRNDSNGLPNVKPASSAATYRAGDPEKGDAAAAALREQGTDAVALQCDVTDHSSVLAAAEVVRADHGHVDILINNAGILPGAAAAHRVSGPAPRHFRETFATNLFGVVATTEALLPLLLDAPWSADRQGLQHRGLADRPVRPRLRVLPPRRPVQSSGERWIARRCATVQ
jgi:NAD(P)-dependent dehydrogenase (short-subunit alcohol dehydrogenase family)